MSCQSVRRSISPYWDDRLQEAERRDVKRHLSSCRECATHSEQIASLRIRVRELPVAVPPRRLETQLRVMASRERRRNLQRKTFSAWVRHVASEASLRMNNLMRPLALPFAGGLVSAIFLFSMVMPKLGIRPIIVEDVPTGLYTEATVKDIAPFGFENDDVMVELVINEEGRMVDYSVPSGHISPEMLSRIGNLILFTSFNPATSFGQPTPGRIRVSFRRSHIVVKA